MKTKDKSRKWMWWFLGVVVALQMYFVRELLAAFALFALGFGVVAFVISALYLLHQGWAVAVHRVAESENPVVVYAKRGAVATMAGAEELAKRAVRGAGSAAAR
jgi:hypothetical protein